MKRLGFTPLELASEEQVQEHAFVLVEQLAVEDDLVANGHERVASAYLPAAPEDGRHLGLLLELACARGDCEGLEVEAGEVRDAGARQAPDWWLGAGFNSSVDFSAEAELIEIGKHGLSEDRI